MATINFDDITSGVVTDQYASQGVSFSNAQIYVYNNAQSSAPNGIVASSSGHFDQNNPISITFDAPKASVSILGVDVGDAGAILKAYDTDDHLLGTDSVRGIGTGGDADDLLTVTQPGIAYVKVSQIDGGGGNDGIVFDNLTFTTPAPVTYGVGVSSGTAAPSATASGPEGSSGPGGAVASGTTYTFTVSRSGDTTATDTVGLSFAGSTATAPGQDGSDYAVADGAGSDGGTFAATGAQTGTLQFRAGQSTATFTVTSAPDRVDEPDETVMVTLTDASSGAALGATATATITNDDAAPSTGGGGGSGATGGGVDPGPASTTPASPGADALTGTSGPDTIAGQGGDDTIAGGSGDNLLLGNQGNDVITAGDGRNTICGGLDDDAITVGNGSNLLYGNEGSDTILAGDGGNTIMGGQDSTDGADLIMSGAGNDLVFGNGGEDTVAAGGGQDTVVGGFGRDVLLGNRGDDLLLGNQGDDTLVGGQGGDTVVGGQGNDVLYGNQGDDVLYGNQGSDRFVFAPGDTDLTSGLGTGDTIADFVSGADRIDFASGPAGTASNFGATATTSTGFASIQALAQQIIDGGQTYAFVADGVDGFLFTTGETGTTIADAVKLAGAGTATSLTYRDIGHDVPS